MTEPFYDRDGIVLYHGKCEEILPQLTGVDVIISDPPYSENTHGKNRMNERLIDRSAATRVAAYGFDSISDETMAIVAQETARLATRWSMYFSDLELTYAWRNALTATGLEYVRTMLWVKTNPSPQFTGDRPSGSGADAITLVHPKGKKRWNGRGRSNVFTYPTLTSSRGKTDALRGEQRFHTTQKPLALIRELVALFTDPDEVVLDPFSGSATTLRAAKDLGRRAIGIEMDERYCTLSAQRLDREASLFGFGEPDVDLSPFTLLDTSTQPA